MSGKIKGLPTKRFSELGFGDVFAWGSRVFVKIRPAIAHGDAFNAIGIEHDATEYLWEHEVMPLSVIQYEPKQ